MKIWLGALLATAAFVIAGCSGGTPSEIERRVEVDPSTTNAPVEGEFKVALLTPAPVSDSGWSAIAMDGLQAIEKELGAKVSNQVARDSAIRESMRSYAQDGYQLIIGHGFEYNEPAAALGADFPKTVFVTSSGGRTEANVGAFRFYLEQGFYLAGVLAAGVSKTGTVAMIGGPDVPSIRSTFKAFKAGAEAGRPGIKVIEKFTGKNDDVAAAYQATLQAIQEGADVVIHQANAGAGGVFNACKEKKVYAIGANFNQNDENEWVIASAVINAREPFVELAREVKEGKYRGEVRLRGMQEKAVDFILNPKLAAQVPAELRKRLDTATLNILNGALVVPKDEF